MAAIGSNSSPWTPATAMKSGPADSPLIAISGTTAAGSARAASRRCVRPGRHSSSEKVSSDRWFFTQVFAIHIDAGDWTW